LFVPAEATGVEVNVELAFEQAQHRHVAAINGGTNRGTRRILLAPEGFNQ